MKLVSANVTRVVARSVLQAKKHSPHIFFAGGIAGILGSTILACRATLKLEDKLDEIKEDFSKVKLNEAAMSEMNLSVRKEHIKDVTYVYVKSAKTISKLYGPSVFICVVSISALTGSHIQLTRRNTALTAAFGAISKSFDEYRERVREEIGKDKEQNLYLGMTEETVKVNGKNQIVKLAGTNGRSRYARFFDEGNNNFVKSEELNRLFIHAQERFANDMLHARGHVILNEVYDMLGLERSTEGAVVGWILDGPNSDNYITFGMFSIDNQRFINQLERSVLLDFNVDGIVYDKI